MKNLILIEELANAIADGEEVTDDGIMLHVGGEFYQCLICGQHVISRYESEKHRTTEMDMVRMVALDKAARKNRAKRRIDTLHDAR